MRQIFLTLFAGVAIGYFLSAKKKKTIATKSCEESRILENHSDLQTEIRMMEIADEKLSTAMNFVELEIKNFELKDEIGSLRKEISLLIKEKNELRSLLQNQFLNGLFTARNTVQSRSCKSLRDCRGGSSWPITSKTATGISSFFFPPT